MHLGTMLRMQWFIKKYLSPSGTLAASLTKDFEDAGKISILDVGSCSVNGTYRDLLEEARFKYSGLDVAAGPNVDIVVHNPYDWHMLSDESFDVIISGQAFEHIEFFWWTMQEMARVLKPSGLICIIAPRGFERHRYPFDTYRFDVDGMIALAKYTKFETLHASTNLAPPGALKEFYSLNGKAADSMLVARKPQAWSGILKPEEYRLVNNELADFATGFISYEQQGYQSTHELLDNILDKKLVLFGAGPVAEQLVPQLSRFVTISYICDNNKEKHGTILYGLEVKAPVYLMTEDKGDLVVIISVANVKAKMNVLIQLYDLGVNQIFFYDSFEEI